MLFLVFIVCDVLSLDFILFFFLEVLFEIFRIDSVQSLDKGIISYLRYLQIHDLIPVICSLKFVQHNFFGRRQRLFNLNLNLFTVISAKELSFIDCNVSWCIHVNVFNERNFCFLLLYHVRRACIFVNNRIFMNEGHIGIIDPNLDIIVGVRALNNLHSMS